MHSLYKIFDRLGFKISWSGLEFWLYDWFYFQWSIWAPSFTHSLCWYGCRFLFRLPWDRRLQQGDSFPHGFQITTGIYTKEEAILRGEL